MYGQDILCGISKETFEIPHKISSPYIERYIFDTALEFKSSHIKHVHNAMHEYKTYPNGSRDLISIVNLELAIILKTVGNGCDILFLLS